MVSLSSTPCSEFFNDFSLCDRGTLDLSLPRSAPLRLRSATETIKPAYKERTTCINKMYQQMYEINKHKTNCDVSYFHGPKIKPHTQ